MKKKYLIFYLYAVILIIFGMLVDPPGRIFTGLASIINSPDLLITDYFEVGGIGATFVNAGLVSLCAIFLFQRYRIDLSGVSIACIWLLAGFSLFGKNIFNIWFIIGGVALYAKVQKDSFSKYIYMALFGASLSPMVTQVMFLLDKPFYLRFAAGALVGLSVGFLIPPLSTYLIRVHQGYSLYNIGFTAGIIGTIYVSVFRSYGYDVQVRLIWSTGNNHLLAWFLFPLFLSLILLGCFLDPAAFSKLKRIYRIPGRLISDFVIFEGFAVTLINMGINGILATLYIILIKGSLNGPTIGGIFTIVGFSAFGKHLKNMFPLFLGVALGSLTKIWKINDPAVQLAALFSTTLAPIAGEFGLAYGVVAGFLHLSVVLNVGYLHGGLNLFNNGFAGGIVAAALVPIVQAFRRES